ncbi:MAG: hypothetical protein LEGION0403_FIIPPAGN_02529 [Legionella sp.]
MVCYQNIFSYREISKKQVSKRYHYDNRNAILKKYNMSIYSSLNKAKAARYAKELIKQHAVPKYVFDSLLEYFHQHKIVRPSYTTLQEMVSDALNNEKTRLSNKIYTLMDKPLRESLANFLEKDELFYQLTTIKKDQKDFFTGEINASVKKHQFLSTLYQRTIEIIKELDISKQNIMHYAYLAVYHTVYGLRAMKQKNLSRLYLMCYAHYRYLKISDHLVNSFAHKVNYYKGEAETYQTEAICNVKDKDKALQTAITFMKEHFANNKSFGTYQFKDVPIEFIPKALQRHVIKKTKNQKNNKKIKSINADRYEFMLYLHIEDGIKTGSVTIYNSLSYRSLNDELHPKQDWDKNKNSIIKCLENKLLATDINDILKDLASLLSPRYKEVNGKITSGENNKIKLKQNKQGEVVRWHFPYKKSDDGVNNPFYENIPLTSVGEILQFANTHTGLMKKFTHILPMNSKKQADEAVISACLVAKATGIDIDKMKDISDVKENDLKSTYADFIRHMTLTQASDVVMNHLKELPIFEK